MRQRNVPMGAARRLVTSPDISHAIVSMVTPPPAGEHAAGGIERFLNDPISPANPRRPPIGGHASLVAGFRHFLGHPWV
jgi:hypothetical protein